MVRTLTECKWINAAATIANDLTIQEGSLETYNTSGRHLTVSGNVEIQDGGILDMNNTSANDATFGAIQIDVGGTYDATSGSTILTDNGAGGGGMAIAFFGGTFTHNNGLVKVQGKGGGHTQYIDNRLGAGGSFYDVEI